MAHSPSQAFDSKFNHPGVRVRPADAPHFVVSYHLGKINHCPGCAGTQWYVGRESAQCAICETALPLAQIAHTPVRPMFVSRFTPTKGHA